MKVAQLIKELQKMPKTAVVYTQDHDHGEHETNSKVHYVGLLYKEEANHNDRDQSGFENMPNKWVSIGV